MASIPLPALGIHQQEQPNLLQQVSQIQSLKGMMGQQQLQQQELANAKLQNQQQQYQFGQTQATNDAYHGAITTDENGNPKIDTNKLSQSLAQSGHGSAIPGILKSVTDYQKSAADLQKTQSEVQAAAKDSMGFLGNAIKQANYDPHLADLFIQQRLATPGVPQNEAAQLQQMRQQIQQSPDALKGIVDSMVAQAPKQQEMKTTLDAATIRANGGVENRELNDWLTKNPGKGPADYQAFKVTQSRESEIAKETDPRVLRSKMNLQASEAQIQQTIKNGSAKDAGALMAGGFVAPSEITARSNPSFLVQAVNEARRIDPTFNPQKAEADFSVAKSQSNLGFFGSAKSLTDKGGTLDQLAAAAKDIPQHDIPVFNTVDDAVKAASGSGPVAKYASLLVGVSDDYSKVMGGGTGSDASRAQGFKLAAMSASPDQRENALSGIRGAVNSQINSRIGNNRVLKNMYGQQDAAAAPQQAAPPAASVKMIAPNGQVSDVPADQVSHYESMGAKRMKKQ